MIFDEIDRFGIGDNGIVDAGRCAVVQFFNLKGDLVYYLVWQWVPQKSGQRPYNRHRHRRAGTHPGSQRDG